MSELDAIEARCDTLPDEWTQKDASAAFRDRAFLLGWTESQKQRLDKATSELKFLRGERKSLLKHIASWEDQGHANVGLAFLRRHLAKKPNA